MALALDKTIALGVALRSVANPRKTCHQLPLTANSGAERQLPTGAVRSWIGRVPAGFPRVARRPGVDQGAALRNVMLRRAAAPAAKRGFRSLQRCAFHCPRLRGLLGEKPTAAVDGTGL